MTQKTGSFAHHLAIFRASGIRLKGEKDLIHINGLVFDKMSPTEEFLAVAVEAKGQKGVKCADKDITRRRGKQNVVIVAKGKPYVYVNVNERVAATRKVRYNADGTVVREPGKPSNGKSEPGPAVVDDLRDLNLGFTEARPLSLLRMDPAKIPLQKALGPMVGAIKKVGMRQVLFVLPEDLGVAYFTNLPLDHREVLEMHMYPIDAGQAGESKGRVLKNINPMGKPVIMSSDRVIAEVANGGKIKVKLIEHATAFHAVPDVVVEAVDLAPEAFAEVDASTAADSDDAPPPAPNTPPGHA